MIAKKDIQTFNETHRILLRSKDYIYLLPHSALLPWVSNYTITFPNNDILSDCYTVIPHGSATLVFSRDGNGLNSNMFGPITKPCLVGSQANQCEMLLIIEFQPAGLHGFTGMNQKELTDRRISFEMVDTMLHRLILEILHSATHLYELVTRLDRLLLSNLHTTYPSEFQSATQIIIEQRGGASKYCL